MLILTQKKTKLGINDALLLTLRILSSWSCSHADLDAFICMQKFVFFYVCILIDSIKHYPFVGTAFIPVGPLLHILFIVIRSLNCNLQVPCNYKRPIV